MKKGEKMSEKREEEEEGGGGGEIGREREREMSLPHLRQAAGETLISFPAPREYSRGGGGGMKRWKHSVIPAERNLCEKWVKVTVESRC